MLKAITNAHPRIAPYPFTTLNPYIGTLDYPDFWSMSIADMPGIIAGAHKDKGLGIRFLRHIERNKLFVYVLDVAGPDPYNDFQILQYELESYKPGLTNRPTIIVANKADVGETARSNLEKLKNRISHPIVPVSAKYGVNVTKLTNLMRQIVENTKDFYNP